MSHTTFVQFVNKSGADSGGGGEWGPKIIRLNLTPGGGGVGVVANDFFYVWHK